MILDLDKAININLILRQGDNYDPIFIVKKNDVYYDWVDVYDLILQIKTSKRADIPVIELKKSRNEIEISTGQMIWHLNPNKTNVSPGDYKSLELLVIYTNNKPKTWIDGTCKILERGINLG